MRHRTLWVVLLFFQQGFSVFAQEELTAPAYTGGQFWLFKVTRNEGMSWSSERIQAGEYEAVRELDQLRVFRTDGNQRSAMAGNPPEITRMVVFTDEPGIPYVKFPLRVGAKWEGAYSVRTNPNQARTRTVTLTLQNEVLGIQTLTTSAGTLESFKIRRKVRNALFGQSSGQYAGTIATFFYSEAYSCIAKLSEHGQRAGITEIELIRYGMK